MSRSYNGYLVVNHFLNANKYNELYDYFLEAAKKYKINLVLKTNAQLLCEEEQLRKDRDNVDFVLFWDKDIRLAKLMETMGYRLYNNAAAIEICDDKSYTYQVLRRENIRMPKTIVGPMTFEGVGYSELSFADRVIEELGLPFVMKECFGSFGMQVYLVHTKEEFLELLNRTSPKPVLFQEFIKNSAGKDIRLQVIGDKVVASMYRYSDSEDFRANLSIGGKMKQYTPTEEQMETAIRCCNAIGLDFAGVDLLFGDNGEVIVCEVNSNAHFKNIYDCTKVNAAELILDHIIADITRKKEN